MKLKCPKCVRILSVRDEFAGRKVKCPACRAVTTVPGPTPPEVPSDAIVPRVAASRSSRVRRLILGRLVPIAVAVSLAGGGYWAWRKFAGGRIVVENVRSSTDGYTDVSVTIPLSVMGARRESGGAHVEWELFDFKLVDDKGIQLSTAHGVSCPSVPPIPPDPAGMREPRRIVRGGVFLKGPPDTVELVLSFPARLSPNAETYFQYRKEKPVELPGLSG